MKARNRRVFAPIMVLVFTVFCTQFLSSWGATGHRIVAEIAEGHLTPEAKQAIERIIGPAPLASIATWPDSIYSEEEWNYARKRHFVTIPDDKTLAEVVAELKQDDEVDNVYEAVEFFTAVLQGKKEQRKQFADNVKKRNAKLLKGCLDASALAFLVHFVGDVHQPMHVGRPGDQGGNLVYVKWFGQKAKLHSVWDSNLLESEKLSYSEYTRFIDLATPDVIKDYQKAALDQWTQESIDLRKEIYKDLGIDASTNKAEKTDLSFEYIHDFIEANNERLLKGGIRLASLLNTIFK